MPTMPMTTAIRILLVNNQTILRTGLRLLIESWPGMTVVAEAANLADALTAVACEHPDLILLDLDSDDEGGLDAIADLAAANGAPILLLASARDLEAQRQGVRAGAMGVVIKERPPEVLLKAIQRIHAGEVWLDRAMVAQVLHEISVGAARPPGVEVTRIALLTGREREVIALIGEGLKNRQIADRMHISEPTVRHHLTSIFEKLGVKNRLELVVFAHRHELIRRAQSRQPAA